VPRRPLDVELIRRRLVADRNEARAAIEGGLVTVGGRPAVKASTLVAPEESVRLDRAAHTFVSRGGEKLAAALQRFRIEVADRDCLDLGASTGGFTDCLLRGGAARVIAVDVGYGQLAWSLRKDPRVVVLERTNVRELTPEALPFAPGLVVADLSFISLRLVLPTLGSLMAEGADVVLLVEPQFEIERGGVGRGGVVRDPASWWRALEGVAAGCRSADLGPRSVMASPLRGPAGNVEFLLHAVKGGAIEELDLDSVVRDGKRIGWAT
jgi:23S rRNA (cytidine1920-2'-O)/16S rRNA (cytidine1409-2'-O)-methyltransferase